MSSSVLVTGGAGYFGEVLCHKLLNSGARVRSLDLHRCAVDGVDSVLADIRDPAAVQTACAGADVIYHNVAQVPLAKDRSLFETVNRDGVANLVASARAHRVGKIVYTSSSAVFGVPKQTPVTASTPPRPAEAYGAAKLAGERICLDAVGSGLEVTVIRPRTILGHGRLGILQILFEWIAEGRPVPVFNGGHNVYQFVHCEDLADACIAAGNRSGSGVFNIGSARFGTMRDLLEGLIAHAGTGSRVKSLPMRPVQTLMNVASALGLSPLGPYHSLMYGREMFFDISEAQSSLGYAPRYSDLEAICESYDAYMANRESLRSHQAAKSHHLSPVKQGVLAAVPSALRFFP